MINLLKNKCFAMDKKALENLFELASKDDISQLKTPKSNNKGVKDEISIIDIKGPLFKENSLLTAMLGSSSYEDIGNQLDEALASDSKAIIFDIDSPGGEVAGCSELSEKN